jgi:hypothetical protein
LYSRGFQLNKLKFISGGQRNSVSIADDLDVMMMDLNDDGFYETCRIIIPSKTYPLEQYKIYFPGYDGDQTYEIRPPRRKRISGNTIIVDFDAWMLIDPDVASNDPGEDPAGIDLTRDDTLVKTVDVYREWNDTTKDHVLFYSNEDDLLTSSGGYIIPADNQGYITGYPATYNLTSGAWEQSGCVDDIVYASFYYYSGSRNSQDQIVKGDDDFISPSIATAISFLASSRIDRSVITGNNTSTLIEDLRHDYTESNSNENAPFDINDCPFGTRKGEYRSWKMIKNFQTRRFNSVTI